MEALRSKTLADGEAAIGAIPPTIERLNELIASSFSASVLDIEKKYVDAVASCKGVAAINDTLSALHSTVRSEVAIAMALLGSLARWIMVQVPKVEDGGNFGVHIQLDAIKQIQEKAEKLQKAFDAMPDYYEKRAGVWDKVGKKESKESKRSDSSSSTKGGKDGDQSSQTHSESTDEKVTDAAGVPDAWLQLASIDVKCYVGLRELAGATAEALLVTADMVDKNGEKIRRPKGNGSDGGSAAFMF